MLEIINDGRTYLPVLDSKAQSILDSSWIEFTGLSYDSLIEQAGMSVARIIANIDISDSENAKDITSKTVIVLGGKGNNGSDAWVCARHLYSYGYNVICTYSLSEDITDISQNRHYQALVRLGVNFIPRSKLAELPVPDFIVDGILGTGYHLDRKLSPELIELFDLIEKWRQTRSYVIAIDLPSGVDADTGAVDQSAVYADYTVTFISIKLGIAAAPGCTYAGKIVVEPLSMPAKWVSDNLAEIKLPRLIDRDYIKNLKPLRPEDGHKALFGKALLIGGNEGMAGAIALAGQAAARAGAGLITLAVNKSAFLPVLSAFPEGLTHDISEHEDALELLEGLSKNKQVTAIGPGIGTPEWLKAYLDWLILNSSELVIDADALNEISRQPDKLADLFVKRSEKGMSLPVLTPHPGEFKRLAPELTELLGKDRQKAAISLSAKMNSVIVLKGAATVVALPDQTCFINTSGNDGMAKGGSGDCLTGIITGLLAQGMTSSSAACAGVYLHGLAGDIAASEMGKTVILPQDLLHFMGKAWFKAGWLGDANKYKSHERHGLKL